MFKKNTTANNRYINHLIAISAISFASFASFANEVKYKIEITNDNHVRFSGEFSSLVVDDVIQNFRNSKSKWLIIKSKGGEVKSALRLADYIYDNRINVIIEDYCISSCANYIFPAADIKIIDKTGVLGFHGGPRDPIEIDVKDLGEQFESMPKEQKAAVIAAMKSDMQSIQKSLSTLENSFYTKIGVSKELPYFGIAVATSEMKNTNPDKYWGFFYSLEKMKEMNITNIYIAGGSWSPRDLAGQQRFYLIK
jgi:hypothetical protein